MKFTKSIALIAIMGARIEAAHMLNSDSKATNATSQAQQDATMPQSQVQQKTTGGEGELEVERC